MPIEYDSKELYSNWTIRTVGQLKYRSQQENSMSNRDNAEKDIIYSKNKYLMSKAELSFYGCLAKIIGNEEVIHCKVRLADILKTNERSKKRRRIGFNKISNKHLDYVIADRKTGEIKFAIELDDKSHENEKRVVRDNFLNSACKVADLKLLRIKAKSAYNLEELSELLCSSEESKNGHR